MPQVEIFSAGCPACENMIKRVKSLSDQVSILDMHDGRVAQRAVELGISSVPTVVVDGRVVDSDEATLKGLLA